MKQRHFGARPSAVPITGGHPDPGKLPFYLLLLALLFEFGRPQDILTPLKAIPIPTLLDVALGFAVFLSGRVTFSNKQTKLWIGLLIFMGLWVPFANNNYWALLMLRDMTMYFLLYLAIITFVNSPGKVRQVVNVWLAVHVFLAINGILHKGRGVGGWLGDENDFGMEMNVVVALAFFMYQGSTNLRARAVYITLLGLYVMSSVATMSRGAFLGLAAAGTYCWSISTKKLKAMGMICAVGALLLVAAPDEYWERINTITDDKTTETGTAGQRMFTWGIGWEMFLANPILGIGQGNFPWTIGEYLGGRTWQTKSLAGRQAHSLYFTLLPELGFLGISIFLGMLLASYNDIRLCKRLSKMSRAPTTGLRPLKVAVPAQSYWVANGLMGGMVAYLCTSAFISTLYYPTFWILTGLIVALRNTTVKNAVEYKGVEATSSPLRKPYVSKPRFSA